MHMMFLDESGDHSLKKIDSQYPVFCLTGVIADEGKYTNLIDPYLDNIKLRYWENTDIIFHSRDIRKCEPPFDNLLNPNTRKAFYADLDEYVQTIPVTVLASVILKTQLVDLYVDPSNPYEISMLFLMERFLYFLEEINDTGYITVEARDPKSNRDLFEEYSRILANGSSNSYFIHPSRFQSRITKIEFVTKKQNENGHQLADLFAYPIATSVLHPKKENLAFDTIKPKFREKNGRIKGYGLKIFP